MLILVLLLLLVLPNPGFCDSSFSFASFNSNSCHKDGDFICMGSVISRNGSLIITPTGGENEQQMNASLNLIGRVLYKTPVVAWPASFATTFVINIVVDPDSDVSGDGMAFVIAQDDQPSPPQSYGSYMGILGPPEQGGVPRQLAVELDTYQNEYASDPDGNHIAIDTVSIQDPVFVKSLQSTGIDLKSGRDITVQIIYDGWDKILHISVAYTGEPLINFIKHRIIMKKIVPQQVYVGFTAATGSARESHHILSWNFTSYHLPRKSLKAAIGLGKREILLVIVLPAIFAILILIVGVIPFAVRAFRRNKERKERHGMIENLSQNAANAPKVFKYSILSKATKKFSKNNLLGTGGFGSVYKGQLCEFDPPKTIAVKKVSATSTQGEKEYLAEICTIGRLKHKNLVQLQGWCHDRDELLLVYEYMPNGSLDKYIGKAILTWEQRYKILMGLASVLVYLHEECGIPVVHRDVKPNNVMLDSEFNAHLGDFGLARLIHNDKPVMTMVAGTIGYLAPEVTYTGRATPESDVYSFGMVVLEVVCGKRSKGIMDENSLVDYVWELYEKGELLDCVDRNLDGNFDADQVARTLMVGLACLHPGSSFRPSMRKVVQVFLNPDEPLMSLPASRPLLVSLSFSSSTAISTCDTNTNMSMQSLLPDEITITRNPSSLEET